MEVRKPDRKQGGLRQFLSAVAGLLGLAALMIGLFVGLLAGAWANPGVIAALVVGVAGLVVGLYYNWGRLQATFFGRRGLAGLSVVLQCIFALILLVMVSFANTRYYDRFDFTSEKKFELSSYTKNVLGHLERPVAITPFFPLKSAAAQEMVETWDVVEDLLEEYKLHSNKVQVEPNVDPLVDRHSMDLLVKKLKMKVGDIDIGSVVFHCGDKRKHVPYRELMEYPPGYARQERPRFKGEEVFTAAILSVTEEKQTTVYFLSGHGEPSIDSALSALVGTLKRENYRVEELSLAKGTGVPDDADALVVMGPTVELPAGQVSEIESYVDAGGRLLLMLEFMKPEELLIEMVSKWGIEVGNDVVVDLERYYQTPLRPAVKKFPPHEITGPLRGLDTVYLLTRSVSPSTEQPGTSFAARSLVETSQDSWAETNLDGLMKGQSPRYDEGADKKGPVSIAVVAEERPSPYEPSFTPTSGAGKVVVFGDSDFITDKAIVDSYLGVVTVPGNLELVTNAIRYLAGKKYALGISPKTLESRRLMVTDKAKRVVFWLTVVVMPVLVLVAGGLVWFWRRRD